MIRKLPQKRAQNVTRFSYVSVQEGVDVDFIWVETSLAQNPGSESEIVLAVLEHHHEKLIRDYSQTSEPQVS